MKFLTLVFTALISTATLAQDKPVLTVYTYDAFAADWGPARPVLKKLSKKIAIVTWYL